jgi:predicted transcriptional regulator of viral defense system
MAHVLAILQAEPERLWRSREIAELLGDVTLVATYRQLARWTERGMIKRVRTGRYAAITHMTNPLHDLRKR